MSSKKKEFEHDSLEDRQSLVEYLETVTRGIAQGKLVVGGREGEITLEPRGLIRFALRASIKPERGKLSLRMTWKPTGQDDELPPEALRITTSQTED